VTQLVKTMIKKRIQVEGAKVLVLGLSFKENCPDVRNTKVIDIVHELEEYNINIDVYDPWVDSSEAQREYHITPIKQPITNGYDGIILAVAHSEFVDMGAEHIRNFGKAEHVLYDLKYVFTREDTDIRL
ncbi:UDP binding domain-containing protein, partial [Psychrobacter sp. UBA6766]